MSALLAPVSILKQLADGTEPHELKARQPAKLSQRDARRLANNKVTEYDGPIGEAFCNKAIRGQQLALWSFAPCSQERLLRTGIAGFGRIGGTAADLDAAESLSKDIFRHSDQVNDILIMPVGAPFPVMAEPEVPGDRCVSLSPDQIKEEYIANEAERKKQHREAEEASKKEREDRRQKVLEQAEKPATEDETYRSLRTTLAAQIDMFRSMNSNLQNIKLKIAALHQRRLESDLAKPELQDGFREDIEADLVKVCEDPQLRALRRGMLLDYETEHADLLAEAIEAAEEAKTLAAAEETQPALEL